MRLFWIIILLLLSFPHKLSAQFTQTDTLVCGDTLIAAYDPFQSVSNTDSFYVWIGNCPSQIRFDFTTASVPDAADIFYLDIQGNRRFAGSMPYFGGNCSGGNHFSDPTRYPASTALLPQHCLPGFVELYGAGIPLQDSIRQRNQIPTDFKLGGAYWESARLHLDIPDKVVALLLVVKFNPDESTVLRALWDCTPSCCITALGDSVCVGDSLQLSTEEEAISYSWTGPNGFTSTDREPVIGAVTKADEGWYTVEAEYLFDCKGVDSVYVQVNGPEIRISPDSVWICLGSQTTLEAQGAAMYQWDRNIAGFISSNASSAIVAPEVPTLYSVRTQDDQGCIAEASAMVIPQSLSVNFSSKNPSCNGFSDGSILAESPRGQAPFSIRLAGESWQSGLALSGLVAGSYDVEVLDDAGCAFSNRVVVEEAESVSAAIGVNPPSCTGACDGGLNILVMEGEGPFTYFLDNTPIESLTAELCAGEYTVSISDSRGCNWSEKTKIDDPEPFTLDLGKDKKIREGQSLTLTVKASEGIEDLYWPGLCEENCQASVAMSPDSSQWQSVEAWSTWGCKAVDSVFIRVKKKADCVEGIFAPTAFTPNGDGMNEYFTLYADQEETDIAQLAQLTILNKWGNVVWSKSSMPFNSPELGWNGYARGKKVPEGTYTWAGSFIREDGLSFMCGGNVIVMR